MKDLDAILTRLAHAPVPVGLDGIEAEVMARIAARPLVRTSARLGVATIAAAIVMGILGAGFPAREAQVVSTLAPLGPVSPLAPSTLLVGAP